MCTLLINIVIFIIWLVALHDTAIMAEDSSHLVFTYGTLMREQPNSNVMTDVNNGLATFLGTGRTVKKYPLVVGTEYNVPFLLKLEDEGHNVEGEVYEVNDKMLTFLDDFEGHPKLYMRQEAAISVTQDKDGSPIHPAEIKICGVYFLSQVKEKLLQQKWLSSYRSDTHPAYVPSEELSDIEQI